MEIIRISLKTSIKLSIKAFNLIFYFIDLRVDTNLKENQPWTVFHEPFLPVLENFHYPKPNYVSCSVYSFLFTSRSFLWLPIDFLFCTFNWNFQTFPFLSYVVHFFFKVWKCLTASTQTTLCRLHNTNEIAWNQSHGWGVVR